MPSIHMEISTIRQIVIRHGNFKEPKSEPILLILLTLHCSSNHISISTSHTTFPQAPSENGTNIPTHLPTQPIYHNRHRAPHQNLDHQSHRRRHRERSLQSAIERTDQTAQRTGKMDRQAGPRACALLGRVPVLRLKEAGVFYC
jgi:hypothetical protein